MQFEMQHQVGTDYSTVKFTGNYLTIPILTRDKMIRYFQRLGGIITPAGNWEFPSFITSEVLKEIIHNTCFVCGGLMSDGQAIQEGKMYVKSYDTVTNTYQGEIEYPNPQDSRVVRVRKCQSCGHSHT